MGFARMLAYISVLFALMARQGLADNGDLEAQIRKRSAAVEEKLIAWRRDIHQHPELGGQEKRTSSLVADHLRGLNLEVTTGVERTGVVGILKGGKPGRTVALRVDMDALPVAEPERLPFGVTPRDQDPAKAAPNHNPKFFVDEEALVVGVRAMASLAANFLSTESN